MYGRIKSGTLLLKGWFHVSAHVQAMTQDKAIPLFMDQSEASMLSRAKFARRPVIVCR